jgi:hypothetical protein
MVNVLHNHKDNGDVFANVESIMPLPKTTEKLKPTGNYVRYKDKDARGKAAVAAQDAGDDLPF